LLENNAKQKIRSVKNSNNLRESDTQDISSFHKSHNKQPLMFSLNNAKPIPAPLSKRISHSLNSSEVEFKERIGFEEDYSNEENDPMCSGGEEENSISANSKDDSKIEERVSNSRCSSLISIIRNSKSGPKILIKMPEDSVSSKSK
jgi:hypothetical protein